MQIKKPIQILLFSLLLCSCSGMFTAAVITSPASLLLIKEEPFDYTLIANYTLHGKNVTLKKTISCYQEKYFTSRDVDWHLRWNYVGNIYEELANGGVMHISSPTCDSKKDIKKQTFLSSYWPNKENYIKSFDKYRPNLKAESVQKNYKKKYKILIQNESPDFTVTSYYINVDH